MKARPHERQAASAASGEKQKPRSLRPSDRLSILMSFLFRRISNTHRRAAKCPPSVFMYSFEQRRPVGDEDQSFHVVVDSKCHVAISTQKIETRSKLRNLSQFDIYPMYPSTERKKLGLKKRVHLVGLPARNASSIIYHAAPQECSDSKEARVVPLRAEEASLVGFTICHRAEERRGMQSTLATTQKPFSRPTDPTGKVRKKSSF